MPEPVADRPRLLLLDGHSLAYRAFFALPVENFSTSTGQTTNAVYGFTSMLINVLRDEQPTHIGVAFDKSRQTFRLAEYPEYKAKRNKTPDEFKSQLPLIQEVLDALHIRHLELEGYEADDIIATLTTQALAEGFEVLVLTGDRDSLQLVTEHSTVLYPMRGVSDLARMTPEAVEAKYGVPPHRYPEIAALVGEDSDNLPGVPGVGPKTAAKWISEYDGLDNVIAHADKIKGKAGESLRANLGEVIRNRHLNALVCDLHLAATPTDLAKQPWDRQQVHQLFDGLEFRVLRDRLFATLESEEEVEETDFDLDDEAAGRRRARRLAEGARVPRRPGGPPGPGHLACRHRRGVRRGAGDRRRSSGLGRRRADLARGRHGPRGLAGRPVVQEGPARRQGADAGDGRARLDARRARARHRAVGLPRPSRPALLRPGRPDAALPQARAEAHRRRGPGPAELRQRGRRRGRRHRDAAGLDRARARHGARRGAGGARRHPPARRRRAAARARARQPRADRRRGRRRPARGRSSRTSPAR